MDRRSHDEDPIDRRWYGRVLLSLSDDVSERHDERRAGG